MTPAEYRTAIQALGLSQVAAGRWLDVDPRTSRRWASGDVPVPESVAKLLRLAVARGLTPETIDRLTG